MTPAEPVAPGRTATFAWGDEEGRICGLAQVGVDGEGAALLISTAEVAFAGPAEVHAAADEPGARWRVELDGVFALRFAAGAPPMELPAGNAAEPALEHVCAVEGTVTVAGQEIPLRGPGQVRLAPPAGGDIAALRRVSAWFVDGGAVSLAAARPARRKGHDDDVVHAAVLDRDTETGEPAPVTVADPRLSTTYDGDGHVRRVGLELWITGDDEEVPRRAAGEAVSTVTLPVGNRLLDCAFVHWRMEGRDGFGPYVIERDA